jgi:hypothetical protein
VTGLARAGLNAVATAERISATKWPLRMLAEQAADLLELEPRLRPEIEALRQAILAAADAAEAAMRAADAIFHVEAVTSE